MTKTFRDFTTKELTEATGDFTTHVSAWLSKGVLTEFTYDFEMNSRSSSLPTLSVNCKVAARTGGKMKVEYSGSSFRIDPSKDNSALGQLAKNLGSLDKEVTTANTLFERIKGKTTIAEIEAIFSELKSIKAVVGGTEA